MSKQVLDVHQMQHLQELGVELKETMLYWIVFKVGDEKDFVTTRWYAMEIVDESCGMLPAYTLQDMLDALPATIWYSRKLYVLNIDKFNRVIYYRDKTSDDILVFVKFMEIPLIDAAYSLLCWCIENGYVETNKNE